MIPRLEEVVGAPAALEELKHKPGRRRTLRARGPLGTAIVKVYASDRAETVAARLDALAAGPPEPVLPRVLAVHPQLRAVVLSDIEGEPLREAVLRGDGAVCRRAGAAIGRLHRSWSGRVPAPLRPHGVERELEILQRRADAADPWIAAAVRSAAAELGDPWRCSTVVHRDLYEEQVMIAGRIGLIDLDDAAAGPPELDVGNLVAHLDLHALRSGHDPGPVTAELLAGYASRGPRLDDGLLERCRLLARLRLACIHAEPRLIPRRSRRPARAPAGA